MTKISTTRNGERSTSNHRDAFAGDRLRTAVATLAIAILAAAVGFSVQSILNGPPVALMGGLAGLTWRAHLYLALAGALAQSLGKCLFLIPAWKLLRAKTLRDKARIGNYFEFCLFFQK